MSARTLTLRLDAQAAARLEKAMEYVQGTTASKAIMQIVTHYPRLRDERDTLAAWKSSATRILEDLEHADELERDASSLRAGARSAAAELLAKVSSPAPAIDDFR